MYRLLTETPADGDEVEMLLDLAFAPGRGALSSYQLREGVDPIPDLCVLMRDDYDIVVGAIRYWPVRIGAAPALLLGPVAVHPTRQGEGIGAALIAETLARAATLGWQIVLLVGDPPYYQRFGFHPAAPQGVRFPQPVNEERVLVRGLNSTPAIDVKGEVLPWIKINRH
ncbi:MAG: N-acetyltransferase [Pseudomonadota bacterium]